MTYSIIKKSQLEGALRLDAEYFQPDFLEIEKKLHKIKTVKMDNISNSVINFGAYSLCNYIEWQDEGVPYINVGDIRDGYVDFSNIKHISEEVNQILRKSAVKNEDIILTMAGSIGNVAIAYNFPEKINSNQATAKISLKKNYSPYFLTTFLLSKYGQGQIKREIVSSVQPNIFLFQIKNFLVPNVSYEEQKGIEKIFKNYLDGIDDSKKFYQEAEELLLKELELGDFHSNQKLFSVVNFTDCQKANRIDAEYFQPRFEELAEKIRMQNHKKLGDLVSMQKGFEPGSDAYQANGKIFIRVSNLSKDGIDTNDQKYISNELYLSLKLNYQPQAGEILLTKDATPGNAYTLKESIEGIISSGILRLKLKLKEKIESEYLTLCLNSLVGKMQAERDSGGSIISHWKPEQIKNILIPILPKAIQQKIAELVQKSHSARQKSQKLLDEAKKKVEEMIEKGKNAY